MITTFSPDIKCKNDSISHVSKNIFCDDPNTPILQNMLGDSAGVIGAALIGKYTGEKIC